jgi:hypothetical protein
MSEKKPACPMCGSEHLSPMTKLAPTEGYLELQFLKKDQIGGGWAEDPIDRTALTRARVCLDCGFAMLHVSSGDLFRLRQRLGELDWLPED